MCLPCRTIVSTLALSALFLLSHPLQAQAPKPNLSGNWKLDSGKSHAAISELTLNIEQDGGKIHLVRTETAAGKEHHEEFTCTIGGKECESNGTKVSLWFDGPTLVDMEVEGDVVSKISMKLGEDKNSMSMSVTHIVPQADPDSIVLAKL